MRDTVHARYATPSRVREGRPFPQGATFDGKGTNFALFSAHATRVDLCLFDDAGNEERIELPEYTNEVWHGYLPDVKPGQRYGYRVHGPYAPAEGHRFNHHKLLLDPYAREIEGDLTWSDELYGYTIGHPDADLSFDERDSAPFMPKAVVVHDDYDWEDDQRLLTAWNQTLVYETHVRGYTMRHPDVAEAARGTCAGLAHDAVLDYIKGLGVTAVELLPVQAYLDDSHLLEKGLRNYWGYNTLAFFALKSRYLASGHRDEFRDMVKAMHRKGLEVVLDVVYNHTAEGNQLGPTLSFKGIDNATYYRLADDKRYYINDTGTGNTFNLSNMQAMRFVTDSLRYWAQDMHVDGFRFDLATILGREPSGFDQRGGFLDACGQDPVLSQVKLIAEPWDCGPGGYQVGRFPPGWAEWNDKFRDNARSFWKGDEGMLAEFATRFTGSADLFDRRGRRPWSSVNFITAHDGFTLHDLVSYNEKHNSANGEDNQDGSNHDGSCNHGAEGETDDAAINALRERQMKNLLATLLLAQGTPMLLAGDERAQTQGGNNNTYCQDNETAWIDWQRDPSEGRLAEFVRELTALRRRYPILTRGRYLNGRYSEEAGVKDLTWLNPSGAEMQEADWSDAGARSVGLVLEGKAQHSGVREHANDATLLILINAWHEGVSFKLPDDEQTPLHWKLMVSTDEALDRQSVPKGSTEFLAPPRSVTVFECRS
ncbi:glycogen debranching enzyme GlgX [Stenotrophomonas sp. Betaine-02u-21]|uniref:glycogen debranching protein GlgX n=1 Tax=unclassified Stenotrophomonas TaxID=196198 RepID=UPI000C32AA31|nr:MULTISPECIES: glycogen debranching protein GlgX [unclassified Stenotrophomonas]PKH69717.1 glycogen debranching enzyme GlgX [Stenotrophomonas sp. Betaine-02u-23]PKH74177.1 glycogen debranching enzyme GlgX [Stenotrophomonas sp. Betaine-02u-21]PKH94590.1 glycogen debranching enzyme GlgX [Stenotrophomonas sp. Bg11-02]